MASSDAAGFTDWTMLPQDILGSVAERLPVPDYLRFPAIAKAFADVVAAKSFLPPSGAGSPWLLLPPVDGADAANTITFLDISTDLRVYRICHPDFHGRRWVGSGDGWLVTIGDDSSPLFLNPLTRSRITFPFLKTIPGFTDIKIDFGSCPYSLNRLMIKAFHCDQSGDGGGAGYVAVVSVRCNFLAFARDGDDRWFTLDESWSYYQDMIYHRGNLYCLHDSSRVDVWDITGDSPKVKHFSQPLNKGNPSHSFDYYLFLVAGEDELFQVWLDRRVDNPSTAGLSSSWEQNCCTKVFKLDGERWRRVRDLGDRAIFAGNNSVVISTRHVEGVERNRVYFREQMDEYSSGNCSGHLSDPGMSYFSLDRGDVGGNGRVYEMEWKETHWLMPSIKY